RMLEAAHKTGAQAVHPGYGFLSENPRFAEACEAAGLKFIGPSARAMELLGDKLAAKQTVAQVGVPKTLRAEAERIGFPLLIKAAAGGGGKGIHAVHEASELEAALRLAQG